MLNDCTDPLPSTQANFPARAFEITGTIPNPPTTVIVVLNLAVVAKPIRVVSRCRLHLNGKIHTVSEGGIIGHAYGRKIHAREVVAIDEAGDGLCWVRLTRFGDDWLLIRFDARDVSREVRKLRQIPAGEQSDTTDTIQRTMAARKATAREAEREPIKEWGVAREVRSP